MDKLKKPIILSFEYSTDNSLNKKILTYVNQINTACVSIIEPEASFLKKLHSPFVSIDFDYLTWVALKKSSLKLLNKYSNQIRILVNDVNLVNEKRIKVLENIFRGSKVLILNFDLKKLRLQDINKLIDISYRHGYIPSLFPCNVKRKSKNYNLLVRFLKGKKDLMRNKRLFLDSPEIFYDLFKEDNICPSLNFSIHIDKYGNVKLCRFDNRVLGNLLKKDIDSIWDSIKELDENLCKNKCLLNVALK